MRQLAKRGTVTLKKQGEDIFRLLVVRLMMETNLQPRAEIYARKPDLCRAEQISVPL
jgi:hypothetical protein